MNDAGDSSADRLLGHAARVALAVALPAAALGTFASEVSAGLGCVVAGIAWLGGAKLAPVGGAATVAYAALWLVLAPISGDLHEGLGHAWPLVPLLTIPALLARARRPDLRPGLLVAALVGTWGAVEGLFREAHGPFSHHLTLAYALLPPLGVALQRRSALALPIALGVLGSRSSGAVVALGVTVTLGLMAGADAARGRRTDPRRAVAGTGVGLALTVLGLPFADRTELAERAVLWTGGLVVGLDTPAGPGGYPAASAPVYDALQRGFWFPNHAHDSATQLLAVLGPAGWICGLLWITALFDVFGAGAAAGLAGVCVGSLTQDTLGDLEVIRAALTWGALG